MLPSPVRVCMLGAVACDGYGHVAACNCACMRAAHHHHYPCCSSILSYAFKRLLAFCYTSSLLRDAPLMWLASDPCIAPGTRHCTTQGPPSTTNLPQYSRICSRSVMPCFRPKPSPFTVTEHTTPISFTCQVRCLLPNLHCYIPHHRLPSLGTRDPLDHSSSSGGGAPQLGACSPLGGCGRPASPSPSLGPCKSALAEYVHCGVMFTDIVGFTPMSACAEPGEVVAFLDTVRHWILH